MPSSFPTDAITIERHGEVTLIVVSPVFEKLEPSLIDGATALTLEALRTDECLLVVVDLTGLDYFGSSFLGLLIRCWKRTKQTGGMLALAGLSEHAKELLHITALDMVWPLYETRREAIDALLAD